ncbi:MAG: hypothetical protein CM1200mP41_08010 [Gammaproteobacteria bacterium]|nr:MAG: hypothetical protein CM1200mP41_08010 [Gammaproteobacteria bacterium]
MSASSRPANRLGEETSPYLLQHAFNPVDWYPWGTEALARARSEDRPILLSVGYSACHWCHVMERESFENDAIANLMNSLFVNIKVDREERPDLDRIYQLAHQLLTRRPGGWPLTAFLTPIDHAPLFVGTYFPAEPHHGMPGFGDLLQQVAQHYTNNRSQMGDHAKAIRQALQQTEPATNTALNLQTPSLLRQQRASLRMNSMPSMAALAKHQSFRIQPIYRYCSV